MGQEPFGSVFTADAWLHGRRVAVFAGAADAFSRHSPRLSVDPPQLPVTATSRAITEYPRRCSAGNDSKTMRVSSTPSPLIGSAVRWAAGNASSMNHSLPSAEDLLPNGRRLISPVV
jgi:hypothetical protein